MLIVEGGDAEMTQQKNSRKGSAVWPMVLSWLSSLILALLAVFVMLFTTFGNVGYMQSCVKSSGYAQSAYDDMVQDFISYGAATGFDADVMTGFMSVDQVESDMQDAVAGLYAKTLTYYTRDNIAEAVYSAMEQATADRGITLEGETKTAVETVAEAVRMEYASYTAVPLVSQLRTLVQKLQKVMVIGLVVSAVLLCAAVVSMLRISRKDARLGARCLVYALGGAGFMSVDQVESDMQDAVAGLYAKTLTYYTRDNIAEAVYSAMEQATADRGITLEGETKTAVETVAEAVRMEYASYTAVPLVSQLRTLVQKLQKVMVIGLVVSAVLLCAAVVSMLRISRKDARLGARCLVYALGGAAVVCLVLGVGVKPMIGLTRLGIDPPALKNLLIAYVGGLFGRFVVMAVIYFVLAIVLGVLVSRHKKHRA